MQLFEKLRDNYQPDDIFNPDPIIVGGQMGTWLQYHMAQRDGIVANLQVGRLEKNLWRLLQEIDTYEEGSAEPLNKASLSLFVAHCLMDTELMALPVYEPLKKYLGDTESSEGLYFRKLMQLATQIATVFIDYEFKRIKSPSCEGVIESWLDVDLLLFSKKIGKGVRPDEETWFGQVELWQKALYRELFGEGGVLGRYAEANSDWYCSLPMYARQVFKAEESFDAEPCKGETWHIFAMSQISLFHRSLIFTLSELGVTFNVYALNPCAEFWEDLVSEKRRIQHTGTWNLLSDEERNVLTKDEDALMDEVLPEEQGQMHPLLAEWGRPGREGIQLWCQATDYAFADRYSEPHDTKTILGTLQHSLLKRTTDITPVKQDASVQFWSAPEIKREVETLYDSIVHTLRLNPTMRFHDIAVFVTDLERYAPVVQQVFEARNSEGHERIPYSLIDGTSSTSVYSQAVRDLMALSGSHFTRKELFSFLENPCVQAARGITPEMVTTFVGWAERLNIYRHFDQSHRQSAGYAEEYIHTWRMALDRLLLGQVTEVGSVVGDALEAYSDIDSQNSALLSLFVETIELLYRDLSALKKQKSVSEWLTFLPLFFTTWCSVPEELESEKKLRDQLYEELTRVTLLQRKSSTIPWVLLQEFILGLLIDLPGFGGSYLTGGVTVTSLSPKPPVPYRSMYLLGLNEGVFPSRMSYGSLDLRGCRREIGDFSPIETDRYLFLEVITSVKEQLVLSYLSMDLKKDEPLQQSSLVSELKEFFNDYLLTTQVKGCHIPLLNSDSRLFTGGHTQPLIELPQCDTYTVPSYSSHFAHLSSLLQQETETYTSEYVSIPVSLNDDVVVTEGHLKRFLENPLVYRLQQKYGLWGDDEDHSIESEEPLTVAMLQAGAIKGAVVETILTEWFGLEKEIGEHRVQSIIKDEWDRNCRLGNLPTSVLGEIALEKTIEGASIEIERIHSMQTHLEEYQYVMPQSVTIPIALPGEHHIIEVTGNTGHLFVSSTGQLPIMLVPNNFTKSFQPKHLLIAYVRLLILAQTDSYKEQVQNGVEVWCWSSLEKSTIRKFKIPLSLSGSDRRLKELLAEMVLTENLYSLPFESLYTGSLSSDGAIAESFELLGLEKCDPIKESLLAFAEEDQKPIINQELYQEVVTTIETAWESHCSASYVPDYLGFDRFKVYRPDSLEVYLHRFGAILGVVCLKK